MNNLFSKKKQTLKKNGLSSMHREEYKNMCKTNQWIESLKISKTNYKKEITKKIVFQNQNFMLLFFNIFTYIDA